MKSYTCARALQAALIGIAMTASATLARADISGYEFQLVDQTVKKGDAIISVRLIHKPNNTPCQRGHFRNASGYGPRRHAGDGH